MDPSLIQEFVIESNHALESVEHDLLSLELKQTPKPATFNRMFRALHSIKGSSAVLELPALESLAHQAETLLDLLRHKSRDLTPAVVDTLLRCVDTLRQMLHREDFGATLDATPLLDELAAWIAPDPNQVEPIERMPATSAGAAPYVGPTLSTLSDVERNNSEPLFATLLMTPVPSDEPHLGPPPPPRRPETPPLPFGEQRYQLPPGAAASAPRSPAESAPRAFEPPGLPPEIGSLSGISLQHASPPANKGEARDEGSAAEEKHIRVRVKFLDELLQLTGNMVMARNQILSKYNLADDPSFLTLSQCVTEVHKTIVQTRMQPIGTLFDRCDRVVRDLARQLGREVVLNVQGKDLELDRSVLESFSDPLTHLLRNALDHGLESPAERQAAGKSRTGHLQLSARQQGGEILLSLEDDGRGIDPDQVRESAISRGIVTRERAAGMSRRAVTDLIFRSGFSTRDEVTNLSGRGVGLDVVRTNVELLGGVVDVQSTLGKGSIFTARLPLTQALVSSSLISALIVKCGAERYAIPQTAVDEIIKVDPQSARDRIRLINGRMVYQLRDLVLPVVRLMTVLGQESAEIASGQGPQILIVLQFRQQLFGLLVDAVMGVEEIVVRPLPALVKQCAIFAGHTVMGDSQVALILDSIGIIKQQQLAFSDEALLAQAPETRKDQGQGTQRLVVFSYADTEHFAIPLELVSLIEKVPLNTIRRVGSQEFIQLMQRTLPLMRLDAVMGVGALPKLEECYVLIPARVSYPIAVLAGRRVRVVDVVERYESRLSDGQGMLGTFLHENHLVMLLDLYRLFERHSPDRFQLSPVEQRPAHILVAEDSPFFQNLVRSYLEHPPRRLTVVRDGLEALETLQSRPNDFDLLVSDIEMPRMDGYELVRKIRADPALRSLPVIAVTSLATPEHVERGLRDGFDSYLIKLDKEQLVNTIDRFLGRDARGRAAASVAKDKV